MEVLPERQLLLVQRVQRASRRRRLRLRYAFLPVHQVHLDVGRCNTDDDDPSAPQARLTWQDLGAWPRLQPPRSYHLHFQEAFLVAQRQLDVAQGRRAQHLAAHQLARPQPVDEVRQLAALARQPQGRRPPIPIRGSGSAQRDRCFFFFLLVGRKKFRIEIQKSYPTYTQKLNSMVSFR